MGNISKLTPILYNKGETNFNHNGLGKLTKLLANEIDEVLNGEFEAFFEYPANGHLADKIDNEMFIKAKPNKKDGPHVFKIYDYELDTFTQTYLIYARSKNIEDLRNNVILDVNVRGLAPTQAWFLAKNNALDPVVTAFYSDIITLSSVNWERRSLLSTIAGQQGSMIQYWGGEIKHGIDRISLLRRRGQDNVTTVRHGKNLDGLKATYSTKGLVTAIVPYYVKDDGNAIYGDVVESEYINNYPSTYYDIIEYNDEELGLTQEDEPESGREDSTIRTELNRVANRYFDENVGKDLPSINMEISLEDISQTVEYENFKDFEQIEIGDTITVYSKKFDLNINAKVRRVVYNGLTDKNELVEVGTARRSLYDDVRDEFKKVETELKEGIDHAMASADGKNTIYHGTADPNEVGLVGKNNDTYFRTNGQFKEIWSYLDGQWHLEVGDLTGEQIKADIAEQQQQVEEAKQQAVASKQEAIDEAERLVTEQDTVYQELFDGYDAAVDDLTQGVAVADGKASDALTRAGESQSLAQSATEGVERVERTLTAVSNKADDAFSKADNALIKANNIPSTIDGVITDKGLVSGDWVTTKINEETGEINYQLERVRGDVPDVIMGVAWDKEENPILTRTNYVEEFANLDDYELQSAEFRLSVEGLGMDLADVQRDKLDSSVFTAFKTNEYTNDIDGIRQRLTSAEENKLDGNTFQTFKEHDYQVTVAGLSGNIEKLEREKLDGDEFTNFKSNEYQLTVDGFEMALTDFSGAIPNIVLGVEWDKLESPQMERSDYTEELDLTNYAAPDYILGVEWDKKENPLMVRTHDTQESTSKEEFELFLADYSFRADGWDATNTYITKNTTAINSLINNAQGWSQTISYVDENQTKFNDAVSQVDFYKQTIGSDAENLAQLVMTDEAFVTRIGELEGMAEDIILGVEWNREPSPEMTRTGYMDNWTETQVKQLADSWVMNIKSGGDIKTAINATTDGLHFKGDLIHLSGQSLIDEAVIKSAHIDTLNVSKLAGTSAEFTALRSKIITANVIEATHIKADNALFDMLFATNAATDRLSARKAWINNAMIADASIDGAKIQDATIGSAKIADLDVGKVSGDTAEFVQAGFNSISGNTSIDANGISIHRTDGTRSARLGVNGYEFWLDGKEHGTMGVRGSLPTHIHYPKKSVSLYARNDSFVALSFQGSSSDGAGYSALTVDGESGNVNIHRNLGLTEATLDMNGNNTVNQHSIRFGVNNVTTGRIYPHAPTKALIVNGAELLRLSVDGYAKIILKTSNMADVYTNINMNSWNTTNQNNLSFGSNGEIAGRIFPIMSNKELQIRGWELLRFVVNQKTIMDIKDKGDSDFYTHVNMQGYSIKNQSDYRLKRDIDDTELDSLASIKSWNIVDFNWIDDELNKRNGRQLGVIAQDTPDLAVYDAETDTWSINSSKQIMMNTHAIQQSYFELDERVESNEEKIHQLQQELSKANRRIEELESVV